MVDDKEKTKVPTNPKEEGANVKYKDESLLTPRIPNRRRDPPTMTKKHGANEACGGKAALGPTMRWAMASHVKEMACTIDSMLV